MVISVLRQASRWMSTVRGTAASQEVLVILLHACVPLLPAGNQADRLVTEEIDLGVAMFATPPVLLCAGQPRRQVGAQQANDELRQHTVVVRRQTAASLAYVYLHIAVTCMLLP
jgi:hypothetical protein